MSSNSTNKTIDKVIAMNEELIAHDAECKKYDCHVRRILDRLSVRQNEN